jgi:hypothetical protein
LVYAYWPFVTRWKNSRKQNTTLFLYVPPPMIGFSEFHCELSSNKGGDIRVLFNSMTNNLVSSVQTYTFISGQADVRVAWQLQHIRPV